MGGKSNLDKVNYKCKKKSGFLKKSRKRMSEPLIEPDLNDLAELSEPLIEPDLNDLAELSEPLIEPDFNDLTDCLNP